MAKENWVWTGVKIGAGMFIVLPLLILGVLLFVLFVTALIASIV